MSKPSPENPQKSIDPDCESGEEDCKMSGTVAKVMDNLIRVPGTNMRFGLDPVMGLVPVGGDIATSVVSLLVIAQATRNGLPIKTIFKMGRNIMINTVIGWIPFFGDAFSAYYKSNAKNFALLQEATLGKTYESATLKKRSKFKVFLFVGFFGLIVFGILFCIFYFSWDALFN